MIKFIDDYLTVNKYSRPGIKLTDVKGIVVHWVGNHSTSASFNRNYFELRKKGHYGYGSTQLIIGLEGEIVKCMPLNELAYHVGAKQYKEGIQEKLGKYPNAYTIGIECTHIDNDGTMTEKTTIALRNLCFYLCKQHNLTSDDLYLHYDVTGKECHRYYVNNPEKWAEFKNDIMIAML